jgi:hypothetical protein
MSRDRILTACILAWRRYRLRARPHAAAYGWDAIDTDRFAPAAGGKWHRSPANGADKIAAAVVAKSVTTPERRMARH